MTKVTKLKLLSLGFLFLAPLMLSAQLVDRKKTFKEVESCSKPEYLKRKSPAWEERSRIVGELKNAPKRFTIEIFRSDTHELLHEEKHLGLNVYQTGWLEPGTYDIVIDAPGYRAKRVEGIDLKSRTDCLVNIVFGTEEYSVR